MRKSNYALSGRGFQTIFILSICYMVQSSNSGRISRGFVSTINASSQIASISLHCVVKRTESLDCLIFQGRVLPWKHTFSVTCIQISISRRALQEILGHGRLATSEIHQNLSQEDIIYEFHSKWYGDRWEQQRCNNPNW